MRALIKIKPPNINQRVLPPRRRSSSCNRLEKNAPKTMIIKIVYLLLLWPPKRKKTNRVHSSTSSTKAPSSLHEPLLCGRIRRAWQWGAMWTPRTVLTFGVSRRSLKRMATLSSYTTRGGDPNTMPLFAKIQIKWPLSGLRRKVIRGSQKMPFEISKLTLITNKRSQREYKRWSRPILGASLVHTKWLSSSEASSTFM